MISSELPVVFFDRKGSDIGHWQQTARQGVTQLEQAKDQVLTTTNFR